MAQTQEKAPAASTSITALKENAAPVMRHGDDATSVGLVDGKSFHLAQRVANMLAQSTIVPQAYRSNPSNCIVALNMASRIGADPLMVMQNLYVVHGNPGWSSKFLIACFNKCGRFTSIRYEFFGDPNSDEWGCRAWAIEKETGEKIEGPRVTIGLAKKEGWYNKNGSKWQSMPEQMLRYRAAAWLINTSAPEIGMGLSTAEEAHDVYDLNQGPDGAFQVTTDDLRQAEEGRCGPDVTPQEPPVDPPQKPKRQAAAKPAPKAEPEQVQQQTTSPDPIGGYLITCPKHDREVDERDCADKVCREGCSAFE